MITVEIFKINFKGNAFSKEFFQKFAKKLETFGNDALNKEEVISKTTCDSIALIVL